MLKLRGMRHASARGEEVRTFNDPPNVAMLNMNESLGFIRRSARLRLQKQLLELLLAECDSLTRPPVLIKLKSAAGRSAAWKRT